MINKMPGLSHFVIIFLYTINNKIGIAVQINAEPEDETIENVSLVTLNEKKRVPKRA